MNFVGTLPRRYVTGEDEQWRVGKLLRFYNINPRINAIGARVAALDARNRENIHVFDVFFRNHEYVYMYLGNSISDSETQCTPGIDAVRSRDRIQRSSGTLLDWILKSFRLVVGLKI